MKIYIGSYGCTANQDNEAIIAGILSKKHKLTNIEQADIIIINTCVVKNSTAEKIKYRIKEIVKKYPNKKLIITGCMPEAEYKLCKQIAPKASLVNTYHITDIEKAFTKIELLGKRKEQKINLPKIIKKIPSIQIAEGCISSCYFCQVKLAKGNITSTPKEKIIKEIKNYINQGYKKINITSTDCGCYGFDIKTNLIELLNEIIKIKGNFKIRVGMMNPEHVIKFLNDLIKVYKNKKVVKFIHIPVQSGSNKILRDMNRNYKVEDFLKIVKNFRKEIPKIHISTDIIVGYPSEQKSDFNKTYNIIKEIKPEVLNISKFSPRPNTKASKLKQLDSKIIKERSLKLHVLHKKNKKFIS